MNPALPTEPKYVFLRYEFVLYRDYAIDRAGNLFRSLKSGKWKLVKPHPRGDEYAAYNIKHPANPGKRKWVMRHVAVLESFCGRKDTNGVACHGPGTTRSDGALGTCEWKSSKGNRDDRRRDGTHSTGHNMRPGRLSRDLPRILRLFDNGWSIKGIAELIGCSRQGVYYQLNKHGRVG